MSVTALHVPYKIAFEPIVRIGENIEIPVSRNEYKYFRVLDYEQVQPITISVSLSANERDHEYEMDEIKVEDNYFGQWRIHIKDFAFVKIYHPRAIPKYTTKTEEPYMTPLSKLPSNMFELYTWKDDVPVMKVTNPLNEDQVVRIEVYGLKYAIEKLPTKPETYTTIPIFSITYVIGGTGR